MAQREYLTQEIKDNVIQKLEYFRSKCRDGCQDDEELVVVIFCDHEEDTAELWELNTPIENAPFTEMKKDYPLIPVPPGYDAKQMDLYLSELQTFMEKYVSDNMERIAPILRLINLGDDKNPRINLQIMNRDDWDEESSDTQKTPESSSAKRRRRAPYRPTKGFRSTLSLVLERSEASSLKLSVRGSKTKSSAGDSLADKQDAGSDNESCSGSAGKRTGEGTLSSVSDLPTDEQQSASPLDSGGSGSASRRLTREDTLSSCEELAPDEETNKPAVDNQ